MPEEKKLIHIAPSIGEEMCSQVQPHLETFVLEPLAFDTESGAAMIWHLRYCKQCAMNVSEITERLVEEGKI